MQPFKMAELLLWLLVRKETSTLKNEILSDFQTL